MNLTDRIAVITGASSGIGAATARRLAAEGAFVVLAARRRDRLEQLASELPGALAVETDMRRPEQITRLVETTLKEFGQIDVLVNNAGQGLHVPLDQVILEDLVAITELNVYAPLLAMQAVLPAMRDRGEGAIVNISSATSLRPMPGLGGYSATKAALNVLSQVARAEFEPAGISVSLIYPFITATEFHASLRAGGRAGGAGAYRPEPHRPEVVAAAVVRAIVTGETEIVLAPQVPVPPAHSV